MEGTKNSQDDLEEKLMIPDNKTYKGIVVKPVWFILILGQTNRTMEQNMKSRKHPYLTPYAKTRSKWMVVYINMNGK